ncbi:T-cell receptor alpha chain V region RL-5 [Takifugu flavidus]|nr:T-cell receptor alpha chain V region RL-5 [Takifugu flavidus]
MVRGSKITAKVLLQRVQRPSGSAGVLCCSSRFCCVRLCCEAQSDRKPTTCLQQHSTQLLEAFVTPEGHMTRRRCAPLCLTMLRAERAARRETRPPPNVEHQTVSPAALELLAEMEPWLWILWLLFALVECRGEDKVMQPPEDVVAAEGDTVTLDCTFQTSYTNPSLFWYKQDGTSGPQFILSRFTIGKGKTEDEFKERFSSTLNPTMKSAPLKIQELQLSDSAVYYCALRPTVTGSSREVRTKTSTIAPYIGGSSNNRQTDIMSSVFSRNNMGAENFPCSRDENGISSREEKM